MSALRWTTNAVGGAVLAGALMLGLAWSADQSHRWDAPEWREGAFIRLRGVPAAGSKPGSRWVMAVNLACAHCIATLGHTHAEWAGRGWQPELEALVVDTPERLGPDALRALPTTQVWWDARGLWRRRWGHRVYGELLQFDPLGRHVRTLTAQDILSRDHLPGPSTEPAPAIHPREGVSP